MFNFDNSLISDFAKCEAHAVIKHVLGRQSRGGKIYADLGNAGHSAMQTHFNGGKPAAVLDTFSWAYDEVLPPGTSPEKPEFAKENLTTIMDRFCEIRPVSVFPFEPVEQEKVVGIEIGEGLKFWFKRDMLAKEKDSGMLVPVDHKFRFGQINEWWTKKFRLSSQFTGYIWATSQTTGQACDHVYVNAVSFGKLPDSSRKCAKHKVPYVECRRQHAQFELLVYSRSPEQIEKWRQDILFFAKQARTYFEAFGAVEMLPYALRRGTFNESCTFCEFADWCRMGFPASAMEELTVYQPWKPWESETESAPEGDPAGGDAKWFWRAASDAYCVADELPGENWQELPEKLAMKRLWEKGREAWMKVWKESPQAQEGMAAFARERGEG